MWYSRSTRAVACCAMFASLVSCLVLVGWTLDLEWLKSGLFSGPHVVNPVTAVCFLVAGTSLWLVRNPASRLSLRRISQGLAIAVVVVGGLRLSSSLLGLAFNVDRMLFTNSLADSRMAPNTALCFLLVGTSLVFLDVVSLRAFFRGQILALLAATIAIVSLIGYAYGVASLYQMPSQMPMALNTAAVFLSLSIGILLSRPRRGITAVMLHRGPGGIMTRRLLLPIAGIVVFAWLLILGQQLNYYGAELGAAFVVAATVVLLLVAVGWIASSLNKTDEQRRGAEDAMRLFNEELKGRVVQRSGELAVANADLLQKNEALEQRDEQLRQAQKMEAIGTLAGGVAHEFNNLLQAIQGYTRYAQAGLPENGERYRDLQQVLNASQRAITLTKQLLGFGRRQLLRLADVAPNALVQDLVKMLRPLIGEHIRIELKLGKDVGAIHADPGHLEQLIMNLCINARDAMLEGGKLLIRTQEVRLSQSYCDFYRDVPPGRYVRISVTDTGTGIPPEIKERIFEPFFTTKDVGKGTGLGLAMVYGVVRQHGGVIRVYSKVGAGTTFKIYLPTAEHTAKASSVPVRQAARGGTETILIAEDDPIVRDLAVRIVSGAGYSTITAADGEEAVRIFKANLDRVSLALLDVVMPRLSGRDVYEQIRTLKPSVHAVFCSGYDPDTAQLGFVMEEDLRLIQKPFDAESLLETIRECLDENICQPV